MKKWISFVLLAALCLSLCACGSKEAKKLDVEQVYTEAMKLSDIQEEMLALTEKRMRSILGIEAEDCANAKVAICGNSVRTDEIWVVEAVDEAAAQRIEDLAKVRQEQKLAELENYLPDQYEIAKQAQIIRVGSTVCFFVAPQVTEMAALTK